MSPIGGVGINLAIQDAVAAANILSGPLARGACRDSDLARVQKRREFPTRVVQRVQLLAQDLFLKRTLEGRVPRKMPAGAQTAAAIPDAATHSGEAGRDGDKAGAHRSRSVARSPPLASNRELRRSRAEAQVAKSGRAAPAALGRPEGLRYERPPLDSEPTRTVSDPHDTESPDPAARRRRTPTARGPAPRFRSGACRPPASAADASRRSRRRRRHTRRPHRPRRQSVRSPGRRRRSDDAGGRPTEYAYGYG